MPSFLQYKNNINVPQTGGQIRKQQSDAILNATWWEDIDARVGYLYDWYADTHHKQLNGLNPTKDSYKIPIDIKFVQASSQTYSKDAVTFHIMFRPGQKCNVPYYNTLYGYIYESTFPIGLYIDIQDSDGVYNRWLVVDKANYNVNQFPTFEVLRCDKVIQYVFEQNMYEVPSVLRSQNSYVLCALQW